MIPPHPTSLPVGALPKKSVLRLISYRFNDLTLAILFLIPNFWAKPPVGVKSSAAGCRSAAAPGATGRSPGVGAPILTPLARLPAWPCPSDRRLTAVGHWLLPHAIDRQS